MNSPTKNYSATQINHLVGERIRLRRLLLSMSQQELADACAISPQQIHKYETGQSGPSIARLLQFGAVLDVPIGYFSDGFDDEASTVMPTRLVRMLTDRGIVELLKLYVTFDRPMQRGFLAFARQMARSLNGDDSQLGPVDGNAEEETNDPAANPIKQSSGYE